MAEKSESVTSAASLQPELWTSSANDVLKVFITDPNGAISFPPIFTYPLFGDSETIYGYQDLVIYLCFDHLTFRPFLNVKYTNKLEDDQIIDVKETMLKVLPESVIYKDELKWVDKVNEEKKSYKIPGETFDSFEKNGEKFTIYKINLRSVEGIELHKRLQILVLFFIEAGSYIDVSDPFWNLYILYKHGESEQSSSVVGFVTAYNYWTYPGHKKFDEDIKQTRTKISQMIILPNHQGKGLGGSFYSSLYTKWHTEPQVYEIVVEDPNEAFDDLRDRSDLQLLKKAFDINKITTATITKSWINTTRLQLKLDKRQFSRLLEMILLYNVNHGGSDTKKAVRLFIKKRLYENNKDGLLSLDEPTRRDKLQTAYVSLELDYYRILGNMLLAPAKRAASPVDTGPKRHHL